MQRIQQLLSFFLVGEAWYKDGPYQEENGDLCAGYFIGVAPGSNYNIDLNGRHYLLEPNYWPLPLKADQCVLAPPNPVPYVTSNAAGSSATTTFPTWAVITVSCIGFGMMIGMALCVW